MAVPATLSKVKENLALAKRRLTYPWVPSSHLPPPPPYPRRIGQVPFFLLPAICGVGIFVGVYVLAHQYDVSVALRLIQEQRDAVQETGSRRFQDVGSCAMLLSFFVIVQNALGERKHGAG